MLERPLPWNNWARIGKENVGVMGKKLSTNSIVKYIFLLHVFICFTFIYIYEFYDIFNNKV